MQASQEAVAAAEKALIELRNSGVDEGKRVAPISSNAPLTAVSYAEIISDAQIARHSAQERLDAAYRSLVAAEGGVPDKIAHIDDEEAEESENESEEDKDDDMEPVDLEDDVQLADDNEDVDEGDDDDEDYKPSEEHAH